MQRTSLPTELSTEYTLSTLTHFTHSHRKSHFAPAFLFLSSQKRQALELLYAVCRVLDDAVDEGMPDARGFLTAWKRVFRGDSTESLVPYQMKGLADKFMEMSKIFDIPMFSMIDLIEKGVEADLSQNRFETPMDLERYCYGVAGTVGVACLPIFGVPVEPMRNFAIRLGIAIQWINCVRDVGVDAKMGRIYLPLEHLQLFGYTEQDLLSHNANGAFRALMKYEADVARSHFRRATDLLPEEWKKQMLPARIMGQIYLNLLDKCERRGFPVFKEKIRLNFFEKLISVWQVLKK